MIEQDIYIDRVGWHVMVYHCVTCVFADEILDELIRLGCKGDKLEQASRSLWNGCVNSGITFSDIKKRETVMVIGLTTSGSEYWNSLEHEMRHLLQDIEEGCMFDHYGEDIAYVSGEFIRDVYPAAKHLLCDCCRHK
ncbi:MAG: hypothetical protein MJZ30_06055 [Paludibacteraceae bacterium]|nr:hypothetical protein [Paludibacteraceae bacterium]